MTRDPATGRFARTDTPVFTSTAGSDHIQAVLTRRPPSVADVLAMYPREGEG